MGGTSSPHNPTIGGVSNAAAGSAETNEPQSTAGKQQERGAIASPQGDRAQGHQPASADLNDHNDLNDLNDLNDPEAPHPLDLLFGGPYMQKGAQGEICHSHSELFLRAKTHGLTGDDLTYETAAIHLTLLKHGFKPSTAAFVQLNAELCEALSLAPTPLEFFKRIDKTTVYVSSFIWASEDNPPARRKQSFENVYDYTDHGRPDYYQSLMVWPWDNDQASITCKYKIIFAGWSVQWEGRICMGEMLERYLNVGLPKIQRSRVSGTTDNCKGPEDRDGISQPTG